MLPRSVLTALVLAAPTGLEAVGAPPVSFRVVATSADTAPLTSENFTFFDAPVVNGDGEVVFTASIGGEDDPDATVGGVWSERGGAGVLGGVALIGQAAPGGSGAPFFSISPALHLSDQGDVVFQADIGGFDNSLAGLWTDRGGTLAALAVEAAAVPGVTPARTFGGFFRLRSIGASTGAVAYSVDLGPPPTPPSFPFSAVFVDGAAGLSIVAEANQSAPGSFRPPGIGGGAPGEAVFSAFGSPTINGNGGVAFAASTNAGSAADSVGAQGVWTAAPADGLRAVALQGEGAPGTGPLNSASPGQEIEFLAFRDAAVINEAGDVAVTASLSTLVGGAIPDGLWVERGGALHKVAVESEPAPGTGSAFADLGVGLIDGAGAAVFNATLADNRRGLFRETAPGVVAPLAIDGALAPGTGADFFNIQTFAVNETGQVAFQAELSDFTTALFATDTAGGLHKIVAVGDTVTVAGVEAQIEFFDFAAADLFDANRLSTGLGAGGHVAFSAELFADTLEFEERFPDGLTAVLVATIPDPPGGLAGDFNGDARVTAADYTVWRDGAVDSLSPQRYDEWAAAFGDEGVATLAASVPEPHACVLAALGAAVAGGSTATCRRRPPAR